MTNDGSITLREFFEYSEVSSNSLAQRMIVEAISERLAPLSHLLRRSPWARLFGRSPVPSFDESVIGGLGEVLNVRIVDIAVAAWDHYGVFREHSDVSEYPPGEMVLVPLVAHTIVSTHKPYVELLGGQTVLGRIAFEIWLQLALDAVVVGIRDGKIAEVKFGSCGGTGSVQMEGVTVLERKPEARRLSFSTELRPPLPISVEPHGLHVIDG